MMAQYPQLESTGSTGSMISATLKVQVHLIRGGGGGKMLSAAAEHPKPPIVIARAREPAPSFAVAYELKTRSAAQRANKRQTCSSSRLL